MPFDCPWLNEIFLCHLFLDPIPVILKEGLLWPATHCDPGKWLKWPFDGNEAYLFDVTGQLDD